MPRIFFQLWKKRISRIHTHILYGQYKFRVILHTFWNWKKITSIQGPRRYFEFGAAKKISWATTLKYNQIPTTKNLDKMNKDLQKL